MRQADPDREACERPRTQYPRRNLYFLLWLRIPREALTTPRAAALTCGGPALLSLRYFLPPIFSGFLPCIAAGVGPGGATGRAAGLASAALVGSGSLSACCSSCDTCHICVGVSMSLKPGIPVRRIPFRSEERR